MAKRKISKQQAQRIKQAQHKRRENLEQEAELIHDSDLGPEQEGLLIAQFYQQAEVEANDGTVYQCQRRQHLNDLVCGDRVIWQAGKDQTGVIVAKQPRKSIFTRPDKYKKLKTIAANIDQIIIVIAPVPEPSLLLLDSYLVAAEALQIAPTILINKIDLLENNSNNQFEEITQLYQRLEYPIIHASTKTAHGLDELANHLQQHTNIFVGQSGVGKSSLVATLLPQSEVTVGEISERAQLGSHTTSTARLYHLSQGGDLIDSPGIREFGLWHMGKDDITRGFKEIFRLAQQCKFRNCQHQQEPECAIQQALTNNDISASRFDNYKHIIASIV